MAAHFCVLASGSSGNASLLSSNGFGLLVDAGLGPRLLGWRLAAVGASWERIHAALLTHIHSDHWNDRTFAQFLQRRIPVYCHAEHADFLACVSPAFRKLNSSRLVRTYHLEQDLELAFRCRPLTVSHDAGTTCAFRFEGEGWAIAYLTDLGTWDQELGQALTNVDILAVEFNHDVSMEMRSGRSERLIRRVLGDFGHLSNEQAAGLLDHVLQNSRPQRVQHVIQLHLSRDCNRPHLARAAALRVLEGFNGIKLHTAKQSEPGPSLWIRDTRQPVVQAWLPGWHEPGGSNPDLGVAGTTRSVGE